MNVLKYETPKEDFYELVKEAPTIFLAGPTVRKSQTHLTSWRIEALKIFQSMNFEGNLIVPEFQIRPEEIDDKKEIAQWEYRGLILSHVNLFWVPRTPELIGLTTNHEMGYWLAQDRGKVIYGRPEGSYRNAYLDTMWELDWQRYHNDTRIGGIQPTPPIYTTLKETCEAAMNLAHFFA